MSDDLVKKADAFLSHMAHEMQDICDYCQRDKAEELVPELVAEVKRLHEEHEAEGRKSFQCFLEMKEQLAARNVEISLLKAQLEKYANGEH